MNDEHENEPPRILAGAAGAPSELRAALRAMRDEPGRARLSAIATRLPTGAPPSPSGGGGAAIRAWLGAAATVTAVVLALSLRAPESPVLSPSPTLSPAPTVSPTPTVSDAT